MNISQKEDGSRGKLLGGLFDYIGMTYVYILRSLGHPDQTYVGLTCDLRRRLRQHNAGESEYTRQFKPWTVETYIAFSDKEKARKFERYLKGGGGWRFARRRLV